MDPSHRTRCQSPRWWTARFQQTSNAARHESQHTDSVSPPLPVLAPVHELTSAHSPPPPPYEDIIDLEKALHLAPEKESDQYALRPVLADSPPLPPSKAKLRQQQHPALHGHLRAVRHFRYTVFSVYRRLFTFVFLLNTIGLYMLVCQCTSHVPTSVLLNTLATLASSNYLLAILVRQDYLVNLLFRAAWLVPWNVPLAIRKVVARVYCYGGLHSGAAVAGTIWWLVFTISMTWLFLQDSIYPFPIIVITWILLVLLTSILILSLPGLRTKYHNAFEQTHRFLGWISILLFWMQFLLLLHHVSTATGRSLCEALIHNPTFWNLIAITIALAYPWLHLRRWTFTAHPLSSHALRLSFSNAVHKFSCVSISTSPLREWHPFATFPFADTRQPGASMVISSAGDWTNSVIRQALMRQNIQTDITKKHGIHAQAPFEMTFWVKSHPKPGVLSLSCLFPRVVILTTGSGIAPSLSSLLDRPRSQFARLIWSTRAPLQTYGQHMMDLVQQADADALVMDTSEMGRPDLLEVAWQMYKQVNAEAVFVLSNAAVTKMVVGRLEQRGVPVFGPIWDS
ncbi:hypothetical protein ACN47E_007430 [Coniothyrium glycines]